MILKFAALTSLVLSTSCMVLHHPQTPTFGLQYDDNPSYNFAYEVNEAHTGDVKSQHESRRGGIVLGQYSLLQPNGVQRTVDYRADDHSGFRATVHNQGRQNAHNQGYPADITINNGALTRHPDLETSLASLGAPQNYQSWPISTATHPAPTSSVHVPVAVSSSSFIQTVSHGPASSPQHEHTVWS